MPKDMMNVEGLEGGAVLDADNYRARARQMEAAIEALIGDHDLEPGTWTIALTRVTEGELKGEEKPEPRKITGGDPGFTAAVYLHEMRDWVQRADDHIHDPSPMMHLVMSDLFVLQEKLTQCLRTLDSDCRSEDLRRGRLEARQYLLQEGMCCGHIRAVHKKHCEGQGPADQPCPCPGWREI